MNLSGQDDRRVLRHACQFLLPDRVEKPHRPGHYQSWEQYNYQDLLEIIQNR